MSPVRVGRGSVRGSGYTLRIVHSMKQAELSEAKQSERGQRESLHHMTDLEWENAQTGAREKRRPKDQRNQRTQTDLEDLD